MKIILRLILFAGNVTVISCQKEISCEDCRDGNKPPIAIAGPDQIITLPTDSIALDGSSSSDPDGTISEWHWTKIAGPASFTIANTATAKTTIKDLDTGRYLFELRVKDNGGLFAKDTVQVVVNDPSQPNRPPIANAGPDLTITIPTNTLTLDGSGSTDPDHNISNYAWKKISGPVSFNIANTKLSQTQVNNLAEGVYQFELKVTDAGGLFSKDTVQVTVVTIPVVQSGGRKIKMIITLPIDSVWIDDWNRADESYYWTKIAGPASFFILYNYGPRTLVKSLVPGNYSFLKVPYSYRGPADTVDIVVVDDPDDRNTITYENLFWEYALILGESNQSLWLWKPWWPHFSNPAIKVYLQMDYINNAQWFEVPSSQPGISFHIDCGPNPLCLYGLFIRPSPEDRSLLENKPCNLKLKIL